MNKFLQRAALAAASFSVFAVAGCREAEQGRLLSEEKGVYQGAPDQEISDETRRQLRERTQHQSFN